MVIGFVQAAERARSPAILQLFPVTLAYGKGPFLQFCLNALVELIYVNVSVTCLLTSNSVIQRTSSFSAYCGAS